MILSQLCPTFPYKAFQNRWTATDSFLSLIADVCFENKPQTIIEAGSGISTVLCAACLREIGCGKVISLEHDEQYAKRTANWIASNHLNDWADVYVTPLRHYDINGNGYLWYDFEAATHRVDVVDMFVVDGPPGRIHRLIRYPCLPLFADKITTKTIVIMDDAQRSDEQEIIRRWNNEFQLTIYTNNRDNHVSNKIQ